MQRAGQTCLTRAGCFWLVLGWCSVMPPELLADPPAADEQGVEFFEQRIRPILADHCYRCHNQQVDEHEGGLALDTRDGILAGGDSGPVLTAGDPDGSPLIKAVRHSDGELQMPPDKKLDDKQIADLETWVKMGAPQPQTPPALARSDTKSEVASRHWAFQPVKRSEIPAVNDPNWVQSPVDAFILATLESMGMQPAPQADRRTLIRRAAYALIGLPPAPEEVAAFLADDSPDAFARVVDRLLASPQYGERWGRHWLDLARYADTQGDTIGTDRRLPYAFTYRDYVIRACNNDLPYDRFILEQIAADKLDGSDNRSLAALGFLTVGRRFLGNVHDTIDDRIDVITRGLMGLTVTCARCHDHKYDPIPTEDYYSLYGVFSSSTEPEELPVLDIPPDPELNAEYLAKRAAAEKNLQAFRAEQEAEFQRQHRQHTGAYLLLARRLRTQSTPDSNELTVGDQTLHVSSAQRWQDALEKWEPEHHPIFSPWFAFDAIPEKHFASQAEMLAALIAANTDPSRPINPLVVRAFAGPPPTSLKEVAERYGNLFREVDQDWNTLLESHAKCATQAPQAPPKELPDPHAEALRQVLYAADAPGNLPAELVYKQFGLPLRKQLSQFQSELVKLETYDPGSPQRAMVMIDVAAPANSRIFVRGNPDNLGREAPRRFLKLLSGPERQPFQHGSGRLELAQAIVDRDNPLTSRLFVNRVWMHLFGEGLVSASSDFGLRSDPPSHPELLDYLAWRFMEDGWSVKKLHRLLLLSNVYQQSSHNERSNEKSDPGNRFLSKMSRRRLDFEAMRDTLLWAAGDLDSVTGGRAVNLFTPPPGNSTTPDRRPLSNRRSVYGYIDRQNLPSLFRTFDFADPDTATLQRTETTVPQQALFFMNSRFVREQARSLARRPELAGLSTSASRIERLYQLAYQRDPCPEEIAWGLEFISNAASDPIQDQAVVDVEQASPAEPLTAWEQYVQVLLMLDELIFVD